jgi:c-di-GMP-binding flagellar brake protein YcgR
MSDNLIPMTSKKSAMPEAGAGSMAAIPGNNALGDQRRTEPRVVVNWRARVMVATPRFIEATVIDISPGGMGLHCDHRVRERQVYDFAVAVPNLLEWDRFEVVQLRAVVQSVVLSGAKFRLGVQFVSIDPAAKALIQQWATGHRRLFAA